MIKPSFHVEVVEPEGVYLLSERGHVALKGELYCRLLPLLDGRRTADAVVDALAGTTPPAQVYYALGLLERQGILVEAVEAASLERAAFWYGLGLDAPQVEARLREATVGLAAFGAVDTEPLAGALVALGLRVRQMEEPGSSPWPALQGGKPGAPPVDLVVALTEDYLREGLGEINKRALAGGWPWLLVKPVGTVLWVGPLFRPGETACWECLAHRLRANRELESHVQRRARRRATIPVAQGTVPPSRDLGVELAALETARGLAGAASPLAGAVTLFDLLTLETERHAVMRRPQCPRCSQRLEPSAPRPIVLESRRKPFLAAGSHRTSSAEGLLEAYGHLASPITGVAGPLARVPGQEDEPLHVWRAGRAPLAAEDRPDLARPAARGGGTGMGTTAAEAQASALGEALETYSATFQGDEIRRRATYNELGAQAVHPNACLLFSPRQYEQRHDWNARRVGYLPIPDPFDVEAPVDWTPVWSLTANQFKYVPTAYCFYRSPDIPGQEYWLADPNGHGVGSTLEEAVFHGLVELIERDSVTIWWYNRLRRPAVDLDSFQHPSIEAFRHHYRQRGRDVWVLDLTTDLGVPVFAAVSRRADQSEERILFGFGAHLDPLVALLHALAELNLLLTVLSGVLEADREATRRRLGVEDAPGASLWWHTATIAGQPYLAPADAPLPLKQSDYGRLWSDDVREDVLRCQAMLERQGLELLVLDQTRLDIGLPAVQVIVPGLRHFRPPRLAPGRLYDVPVKMGWIEKPLAEEQLNPIPLFL